MKMASSNDKGLFQCTGCRDELDLESKTLPCLHSFCNSCLDKNFKGKTEGDDQCPECKEPLLLEQVNDLSPFLVKSLRRQQLESSELKCDICLEDGINSSATDWCYNCQHLYCANCIRLHKKLQKEFIRKHYIRYLEGMEKEVAIKVITTEMCCLHQEAKSLYCEQCNECLCDTCYEDHCSDSPGCLSKPLTVGEAALKQKSEGPAIVKGIDGLELTLRIQNEKTRSYTAELNFECDSKCQKLWQDFEEAMEKAKRETDRMCEEMRRLTNEQVESWRHLLEENEKILKQLGIWRLNLDQLLRESQHDADVVCNLKSLESKLSSSLNKTLEPEGKKILKVEFPDWWLCFLEQLKTEVIGSVCLLRSLPVAKDLELGNQWRLTRLFTSVKKSVTSLIMDPKKNQNVPMDPNGGNLSCAKVSDELPQAKDSKLVKQWRWFHLFTSVKESLSGIPKKNQNRVASSTGGKSPAGQELELDKQWRFFRLFTSVKKTTTSWIWNPKKNQ